MEAFIGALIRKERLKKNYSQEGLCRGICVVSYLSKIEQGRVEAGGDILCALLERLGIQYETDPEFLKQAEAVIERLYEKLYMYCLEEKDLEELKADRQRYFSSKYMLDAWLFLVGFPRGQYWRQERKELEQLVCELSDYVSGMTERQYEVYLYHSCRAGMESYEKLLKQHPNGFYLTQAGVWYWEQGEYAKAIEVLTRAYSVSSEEGTIQNMILAKMILGNCYSSTGNKELMLKNYMVAKRMVEVTGDEDWLQNIYYNVAATLIEWNQPEEAEVYFRKCTRQDALYYHKYAICKEQLGKKQEALQTLEMGKKDRYFQELPVYQEMYEVVEYRLTHENYRKEAEYERLLRTCMKHMRKELPKGYEQFHVPYLIELLEHQRKYKEICELMKEFPMR